MYRSVDPGLLRLSSFAIRHSSVHTPFLHRIALLHHLLHQPLYLPRLCIPHFASLRYPILHQRRLMLHHHAFSHTRTSLRTDISITPSHISNVSHFTIERQCLTSHDLITHTPHYPVAHTHDIFSEAFLGFSPSRTGIFLVYRLVRCFFSWVVAFQDDLRRERRIQCCSYAAAAAVSAADVCTKTRVKNIRHY